MRAFALGFLAILTVTTLAAAEGMGFRDDLNDPIVGAPVLAAPVLARAETNGTASKASSAASGHPTSSAGATSQTNQAANGNATSSGSEPASTVNSLESSGAASAGATATLTADTAQGTCTLDNALSENQQAGWTDEIVNTCCTVDSNTTCWFRVQSKVNAEDACKIPNCDDLNSNDQDRMVGFNPLTSTDGKGRYGNVFPILFLSSAVRPSLQFLLLVVTPLWTALALLL
ncbi:hypothetical protein MYAM1_002380 [Malassezia yamatoensis]|uniref:Extracellular membrane protein CFEM domain-containing protein n=1 Tax=Malassezia yamatoensis TaxID=253288 RepID=A0AAJ5YUE6_9BASI|nr:hypothetical protein MYAM1_002380 [Malassezia yamatoensis]